MLSNRTDTQTIENRKSRAAVPRRGGEVAPRLLPIFRLYYRGGPGYLPQMRYFSQRGLCHDKGEGECRIFGLAVLHWAWRGKSPTSYVYTQRGNRAV